MEERDGTAALRPPSHDDDASDLLSAIDDAMRLAAGTGDAERAMHAVREALTLALTPHGETHARAAASAGEGTGFDPALRPCPMCGGRGFVGRANRNLDPSRTVWSVSCWDCLATTAFYRSRAMAVDRWNGDVEAFARHAREARRTRPRQSDGPPMP